MLGIALKIYGTSLALHRTMAGSMLAVLLVGASLGPVYAGGELDTCETYARDYADAHSGSGDPNGEIVDGAMRGAVAGGAWAGPSGARRGALAGGALGVLDNLGAYPGGWVALYDMAYQMCINQNSPANHRPRTLVDPTIRPNCRSSATVQPVPQRPGSPYSARSGCW